MQVEGQDLMWVSTKRASILFSLTHPEAMRVRTTILLIPMQAQVMGSMTRVATAPTWGTASTEDQMGEAIITET